MIFMNVDLGAILALRDGLEPNARKVLAAAAEELALQTHAHILEETQNKLHSTRDKYAKALKIEKVEDGVWTVTLDRSAMWIEEGLEEHEMIDDLLKSKKTKTAKDGSKYLSVPFQHNKGPTEQTHAAKDLTDTVKAEMRRRKIPYGNIEKDAGGKPKTGLLHSFDILKNPPKTHEGPGQGKGPIGKVRQGPTGIPFLQNIRVYQRNVTDKKTGKSSTQKQVMTFRMVSSNHKGTGRWVHPGLEARKFFDEAASWALDQWERKVVPDILKKFSESF